MVMNDLFPTLSTLPRPYHQVRWASKDQTDSSSLQPVKEYDEHDREKKARFSEKWGGRKIRGKLVHADSCSARAEDPTVLFGDARGLVVLVGYSRSTCATGDGMTGIVFLALEVFVGDVVDFCFLLLYDF